MRTMLLVAATTALLGCRAAGTTTNGPPTEPRPAAAAAVSEVGLERRCFGCTRSYQLVFRRDGTATRVDFGNARQGTADRTSLGRISAEAYGRLAALLDEKGFFGLAPEYRDPKIMDGSWATVHAVRGAATTRVLDHNQAGPPALRAIEDALDAAGSAVDWRPQP